MMKTLMMLTAVMTACAAMGCAADGIDADPAPLGTNQSALRGVEPDEIDYAGDDREQTGKSGEKGGTEDINIGVGELTRARKR